MFSLYIIIGYIIPHILVGEDPLRVSILESSPPKRNLLRPFILFHLNYVIPTLGRLITGESDAYRYLPDSTQQFRTPQALAEAMRQTGFLSVRFKMFMFGTIAIHVGEKPET